MPTSPRNPKPHPGNGDANKLDPSLGTTAKSIELEDARAEAARRDTSHKYLTIDFQKCFDVYLYHLAERNEATRMFLLFFSVPFATVTVFGLTGRVTVPSVLDLDSLRAMFPPVIFPIFLLCGILGLIPFHRFVAAQANSYKIIRYLNGYRLLGYLLLRSELSNVGWTSAIEKDPREPKIKKIAAHWSNLFAYVMILSNTAYAAVGIGSLSGFTTWWAFVSAAIVSLLLHAAFSYSELQAQDVERLERWGVDVERLLQELKLNGKIIK